MTDNEQAPAPTEIIVKSGINPLWWIVALILVGGLGWFIATWQAGSTFLTGYSAKTLQVENLLSLVTNKVTTQVYYHSVEKNRILGNEETVVLGEVEILYGMDLKAMKKSAIDDTNGVITVELPPVDVISLSIRDGSLKVMSKSTILQKIISDRTDEHYNKYLSALKASAIEFAELNGLPSERESVERRITAHLSMLFPGKRIKVTIADKVVETPAIKTDTAN